MLKLVTRDFINAVPDREIVTSSDHAQFRMKMMLGATTIVVLNYNNDPKPKAKTTPNDTLFGLNTETKERLQRVRM